MILVHVRRAGTAGSTINHLGRGCGAKQKNKIVQRVNFAKIKIKIWFGGLPR